MSGKSRAVTITDGSIFFASQCAAPFSRTAARLLSARIMVGTLAWYMEMFIGGSPWGGTPDASKTGASIPLRRHHAAELAAVEILDGLHDLGLGIHHERPVAHHRLVDRLAREEEDL